MNQGHHPPLTVKERARARPSVIMSIRVHGDDGAQSPEIAYQIAKRIRERVRERPIIVHIPGSEDFVLRDIYLAD